LVPTKSYDYWSHSGATVSQYVMLIHVIHVK
jgi:hypothetical protein